MKCDKCGESYDSFIRSKKCPHPVEDPDYWNRKMMGLREKERDAGAEK